MGAELHVRSEFCLGIQPFMQPHPRKNPDGDCFACSMTAALHYLFPERPVAFETAWNYFMTPYHNSDKVGLSSSWPGMRRALYQAYSDGYELEIRSDIVTPHWDTERFSYAWFQFVPHDDYTQRLEGWLRSGYVAFAEINFAGAGPVAGDGMLNTTDHFVVLDGTRSVWEPHQSGGASMRHYVHVICSVRGAYWIRTDDWLIKHGAAAWWLARRDAH